MRRKKIQFRTNNETICGLSGEARGFWDGVAWDEIEIIIKIIIIVCTRMNVGLWLSASRLIFILGSGTDS